VHVRSAPDAVPAVYVAAPVILAEQHTVAGEPPGGLSFPHVNAQSASAYEAAPSTFVQHLVFPGEDVVKPSSHEFAVHVAATVAPFV